MRFRAVRRPIPAAALLCAALLAATPTAAGTTRARLVECGADTCLRLSGQGASAATVVRVGGRAIAVEGGRAWRATVPLSVARGWPIARGYAVDLVMTDAAAGTERTERVPLPPGALGTHSEIASLVIAAR